MRQSNLGSAEKQKGTSQEVPFRRISSSQAMTQSLCCPRFEDPSRMDDVGLHRISESHAAQLPRVLSPRRRVVPGTWWSERERFLSRQCLGTVRDHC